MKIAELLPKGSGEINDLIEAAKRRSTPAPDIEKYKDELDPHKHKVFDEHYRKKREKTIEEKTKDINGKEVVTQRKVMEDVNRIALAMQDTIVERAVAFLFGNEPKMAGDVEGEVQQELFTFVEKIKTATKVNDLNRKVARILFSATEVAEYWYPVKDPGYSRYGRETSHKLRCRVYNPLDGDKLYPIFDESGDFIVFGAEYSRDVDGKSVTYFDVFTDEEKATFISDDSNAADWKLYKHLKNPIGKMPIIYGSQPHVEWYKVQILIDRLNLLLSNFAETNDYHAAPKIFVQGKLLGWAQKGDSGAVIQGEVGSKAEYLSWDHAPDSVKLEIETLITNIYSLTQTPNISFDSVKGLGAISGIALKLLFLDAHLKVKNKEEIFSSYLQRRNSILTSFAGLLDVRFAHEAKRLDLYDTIVPFMIEDLRESVETLMLANGNQPLVSHKDSLKHSPFAGDNPDAEYEEIQKELKSRSVSSVFSEVYE